MSLLKRVKRGYDPKQVLKDRYVWAVTCKRCREYHVSRGKVVHKRKP